MDHLLTAPRSQLSPNDMYILASRARTKLYREAARTDHDLRMLVSHANLHDCLMDSLTAARNTERRAQLEACANRDLKLSSRPRHVEHVSTIEVNMDEVTESSLGSSAYNYSSRVIIEETEEFEDDSDSDYYYSSESAESASEDDYATCPEAEDDDNEDEEEEEAVDEPALSFSSSDSEDDDDVSQVHHISCAREYAKMVAPSGQWMTVQQ